MNDNFGYTFAPTFDAAQQARSRGGASPQGAIQTLNYRLPRVTGAARLSPLVSDEPSGFSQMVLQSVLKTILGPEQLASFSGGAGLMSQGDGVSGPRPHIRVGLNEPAGDGALPVPTDVPQDLLNTAMNFDLGNGRTLGAGGGFPGPRKPFPQFPGYTGVYGTGMYGM